MKQKGIKLNEQENIELENLKQLLNLKDTFGGDSQAYKIGVRLSTEYLNKAIPYFMLYETLFVEDRKKLFKRDNERINLTSMRIITPHDI
jgi:hypothetical protein